nr:MAG TPA: hypothetical protein [Caudoviricetes sp.]
MQYHRCMQYLPLHTISSIIRFYRYFAQVTIGSYLHITSFQKERTSP